MLFKRKNKSKFASRTIYVGFAAGLAIVLGMTEAFAVDPDGIAGGEFLDSGPTLIATASAARIASSSTARVEDTSRIASASSGTKNGGTMEPADSFDGIQKQLASLNESAPGFKKNRGVLMFALGDIRFSKGDWHGAEGLYKNALTYLERGYGSYDAHVARCLDKLTICLQRQNLNQEARDLARKQQHIAVTIAGQPPTDKEQYLDWLNDSFALGHPSAPTLLGLAYLRGEGMNQDLDKARHYFEKGVVQGDGCGAVELGLLYMRGQGVEQDLDKAQQYLELAAGYGVFYPSTGKENNGVAEYELGIASQTGNGLRQDVSDAYLWYSLAKQSGSSKSSEAEERLNEISGQLSPEEKDEYEQRLANWKENQQLSIYPKFVPQSLTE